MLKNNPFIAHFMSILRAVISIWQNEQQWQLKMQLTRLSMTFMVVYNYKFGIYKVLIKW